jgi:Ca-activated chloride channel family protein
LEKKQARQVYEEEKAAGRDAGLTEKDSYKTFDTSVSPVRAGQDTHIRIAYFQPAHVDTGIGRYVYPLEEGGVDEEKLAFWTANEKVTRSFSFDLHVRSGYPVDAVRLPNHPQAQIQQVAEGEWHVHLGNSRAPQADTKEEDNNTSQENMALPIENQSGTVFTLDKDLVVYWRHKAGLPGSVDLVTHKPEGKDRGTFMLVVTPGDDLKPINEGTDWVFVLDISGSMKGKYTTLADGVERAMKKMRPEDRFRIVLFNNNSRELTSGFVNASPQAVSEYTQKVLSTVPGGGTNLYAGLQRGLDTLDADRTSALVLVTDGVANVGETQQRQFVDLVRNKDIRMFTFVMGNSANRPMLQAMTKASNGFAVSISNSDDIVGQILTATSKVTHEALHGVKLKIKGVKTADITPENIGSLYRGQQLVILGHYYGDGMAKVSLSGKISGEEKQYTTKFAFPKVATDNPEIERLWAYAAIESMKDEMQDFGEKADLKQAVTDLAVEYSLVTDYTSMVVVNDEVFEKRGIKRNNQKRLAIENAAQQQRATRPAQSRRVDTQQPMYQSNRSSHSGGGAIDIWTLMLFVPLIWIAFQSRRESEAS